MTATVTIPIIGYSISINSLIAIVLLLCIFFTFFSVSINFVGLDPSKQKGKNSCSHRSIYYQNSDMQLAQDTKQQLRALRSSVTREL